MVVGIVAIIVVNLASFGFAYLMRFLCKPMGGKAYIGYYLVLMPIMFAAWEEPLIWFSVALAMVGLIVITIAAKEALVSATRH